MGLDYAPFNPYQFINRHTITFNPESKTKTDDARKKATTTKNSFTDNLRKYEKKKAEQLHLRH